MTDLDTLVARALGWTDIITVEFAGGVQVQGVRPGTEASGYTGYKPKQVIPKYSTDISAAWELVEKMKDHRWLRLQRFDDKWEFGPVEVCGDDDYITNDINADTAPEAICKAFLEAFKMPSS